MKKKLSKNNLKFIILVFIFLIGIGTFLVQESFAKALPVEQDGGGGGGGGGYTPPPAPTITVNISSGASTVAYGGSTTVTWSSSGATSCTRSDTGASIGTSGSFTAGPLYSSIKLTITCTTDSYCSGSYIDTSIPVPPTGESCSDGWSKKNCDKGAPFNAGYCTTQSFECTTDPVTFPWGGGSIQYLFLHPPTNGKIGDLGDCDKCSDVGRVGWEVIGGSWYKHTCVENRFIVCLGGRWSEGTSYVSSAYATKSCVGFPQSTCSSISGCTWHP